MDSNNLINKFNGIIPPPKTVDPRKVFPEAVEALCFIESSPQPIEMVVGELIDKNSKVMLSGVSKGKKSFFVSQMCLAVASGAKSFLKWEIPQGRRTLLCQLEISDAHYHRRLKKSYGYMFDKESSALKGNLLIINGRGCNTGDVKTVFKELEDIVKAKNIELVVIDPIYKLIGNENDQTEVKHFLQSVDTVCKNTQACVMLVHHQAKGNSGDKQTIDRFSGSGVLARDMDTLIFLDKHKDEDMIVCSAVVRGYRPIEPFTIEFNESTNLFGLNSSPAVIGTRSNRSKNSFSPEDIEKFAIETISGSLKAMTKMELKGKLKNTLTVRQADSAIDKLIGDGKLVAYKPRELHSPTFVGTREQIEIIKQEKEG